MEILLMEIIWMFELKGIAYHGTPQKNLRSILKRGLLCKKSTGYGFINLPGVWLSNRKSHAQRFGDVLLSVDITDLKKADSDKIMYGEILITEDISVGRISIA
jgi:hypothetical protein